MDKELLLEADRQGWHTDRTALGHWVCHAPGGAWHITLAPDGADSPAVRNAVVRMSRHGFDRRGRSLYRTLWTLDIEADVIAGRVPAATQWSDSLLAVLEQMEAPVGPVTFASAASRQIGARFCLEAEEASVALKAAERIFAYAISRAGIGEVALRKVELER